MDAEDDGYCDSSEWTELLAECLACATEYDLWPDYGDGVTAAAEACGLDATPAGASTTAAAAEETTAAAETTAVVEETTAAPDTTAAAEQTTAVEETETAETTAVEETAAVTTTAVVVESAATTPSVVTTPSSNSVCIISIPVSHRKYDSNQQNRPPASLPLLLSRVELPNSPFPISWLPALLSSPSPVSCRAGSLMNAHQKHGRNR